MPRTVLLVDEDCAALADLRRTLLGSSYRVLSARGARLAFEVLAIEPVDVIVCGGTLPEGTGIDFLARVRLRHPKTVRIVLAPDGETEVGRALLQGTAHFSLPRSTGPDTLVRAIDRGLEQTDLLYETERLVRAARRQAGEGRACLPPRLR